MWLAILFWLKLNKECLQSSDKLERLAHNSHNQWIHWRICSTPMQWPVEKTVLRWSVVQDQSVFLIFCSFVVRIAKKYRSYALKKRTSIWVGCSIGLWLCSIFGISWKPWQAHVAYSTWHRKSFREFCWHPQKAIVQVVARNIWNHLYGWRHFESTEDNASDISKVWKFPLTSDSPRLPNIIGLCKRILIYRLFARRDGQQKVIKTET